MHLTGSSIVFLLGYKDSGFWSYWHIMQLVYTQFPQFSRKNVVSDDHSHNHFLISPKCTRLEVPPPIYLCLYARRLYFCPLKSMVYLWKCWTEISKSLMMFNTTGVEIILLVGTPYSFKHYPLENTFWLIRRER